MTNVYNLLSGTPETLCGLHKWYLLSASCVTSVSCSCGQGPGICPLSEQDVTLQLTVTRDPETLSS